MNTKLFSLFLCSFLFLIIPHSTWAMPAGTLLYRTSGQGKMYGYSNDPLVLISQGIIKDVYAGHVAIYIGKEGGQDYIVEASNEGIVKTPAKYFLNQANQETFLGARIPKQATALQRAKVVAIAKSLVGRSLAYDFSFKKQKGPKSGDWTCVGLTEKLYESANISNSNNLNALEYDTKYYAVNITPDGYGSCFQLDINGDCFSRQKEFSEIGPKKKMIFPAPELFGFDLGREYKGKRYIFLPYTQFIQDSLKAVPVDIKIASSFRDDTIRGKINTLGLALSWSLINNPWSSLKHLARDIKNISTSSVAKTKEIALNIGKKIFFSSPQAQIVLSSTTKKASTNRLASGQDYSDLKSKNTSTKTSQSTKKIKTNTVSNKVSREVDSKIVAAAWPQLQVHRASQNKTKDISLINHKVDTIVSPVKNIVKKSEELESSSKIEQSYLPLKKVVSTPKQTKINSAPPVNYQRPIVYNTYTTSAPAQTSVEEAPITWPQVAIISKLGATANNDWIELENTGDHDFDLAKANYRLEKAKTANNPSLIMRIGNPTDGAYPGGTIITAHGHYLIVSAKADDYYKSKADAIATRNIFSWRGNAYSIYLGKGVISSSDDSDIVDMIGLGPEATYYLGQGPSEEVTDNYFLSRVDNSEDNKMDFMLLPAPDPAAIAARQTLIDEMAASSSSETASSSDETDATSTNVDESNATSTNVDETDASSTDEASSSTEIATSSPMASSSPVYMALINRVYATDKNDFIELFNPGDQDFDLASSSFRLEKTKTAVDPSIMMRIGNPNDGLYPGGSVIKAKGKYLIVRDDANDYWLNQADAIATRTEFVWDDSDYTFYLGRKSVSSSTDLDIVDTLGFGSGASYFSGTGPAPAITDNYILQRIATSSDNSLDFSLVPSDDPNIIASSSAQVIDSNLDLFLPPTPIDSAALVNVWHFSDCYGEGKWTVGRWDCARLIDNQNEDLSFDLDPVSDLNNFSLSFYYHKTLNYPRVIASLNGLDGELVNLILDPSLITVEGLPQSQWRYYVDTKLDDDWHQLTLVINQAQDYWSIYIDGQEVVKQSFIATIFKVNHLRIYTDSDPMAIDEVVRWNRALGADEILANYLQFAPYAPQEERSPQLAAQLVNLWDFSEDKGNSALDSINQSVLHLPDNAWVGRVHNNYAIQTINGHSFEADLPEISSRDLSLTFWWRNSSYPDEGRANISLLGGENSDQQRLFFTTNYYRLAFWWGDKYGVLSEGIDKAIPYDDLWHHLALVYDSYRYRLSLYVDGLEKASSSLIWLPDSDTINHLRVATDNVSSEIDDLGIYLGALSPGQVKSIYEESK